MGLEPLPSPLYQSPFFLLAQSAPKTQKAKLALRLEMDMLLPGSLMAQSMQRSHSDACLLG